MCNISVSVVLLRTLGVYEQPRSDGHRVQHDRTSLRSGPPHQRVQREVDARGASDRRHNGLCCLSRHVPIKFYWKSRTCGCGCRRREIIWAFEKNIKRLFEPWKCWRKKNNTIKQKIKKKKRIKEWQFPSVRTLCFAS